MKYIKVQVTRFQYTDLYFEAPDDFDPKRWHTKETVCLSVINKRNEYQWEIDDPNDIEVDFTQFVDKEEAEDYGFHKLGENSGKS